MKYSLFLIITFYPQLSQPLMGIAVMGIWGWREAKITCRRVHGKAEWRFASTMLGEPSVTMHSVLLMLQWHVDSWVCQTRVSTKLHLPKQGIVQFSRLFQCYACCIACHNYVEVKASTGLGCTCCSNPVLKCHTLQLHNEFWSDS